MNSALIVLPHQLFLEHPGLEEVPDQIVLIEDPLFFGDPRYPMRFHKQKLWLHRASMASYREMLISEGYLVSLVKYEPDEFLVDQTVAELSASGVQRIVATDPVDDVALRRLRRAADASGVSLTLFPSPGFLNTPEINRSLRQGLSRWHMADFYKRQRRRLDILMDGDLPVGGKWSFDEDNRKRVPNSKLAALPGLASIAPDDISLAARDSVLSEFAENPGALDELNFPTTHEEAALWLDDFLVRRLEHFGSFEDAIVEGESWLWHSVLTPALNIGLLTPDQVISATLDFAAARSVPLNSLEGFLRQIIGWREFMRAAYEDLGVQMRNSNHWGHNRALPKSFYDATTGIEPIDDVIGRLLKTGYCHHIERLMVLGGFMFLCEIRPDDVYRWFMEMFVDGYDWVMVPNVYAMSQNADGGLITTKPYFSGSNYIRKMSHWKVGKWSETWDGLYWRFIWKNREKLSGNRRWAMMCRSVENMDTAKREAHLANAESFLATL